MRLTEFKSVVKEGGNVFKDSNGLTIAGRIKQADIEPTIRWLESIIQLPLIDNVLGSVGKKASSGDIDIAIDQNVMSKDQLVSKLTQYIERQKTKHPRDWIRKSGISVHFLTPIRGDAHLGLVQTDFMFGDNINQMKFGLYSAGDNSQFSGADRNLLMSSIAKSMGMKYSWQKGLMTRETESIISADPDAISRYLLGPSSSHRDFDSVETIMAVIARQPNKINWLRNLIRQLQQTADKKPTQIAGDAKEAERVAKALSII